MARDSGSSDRGARAIAVWAGDEMIVWGGIGQDGLSDGGAFDPSTGSWRILSAGPLRSTDVTASVWTGDEWVIAVGRRDSVDLAAYNPASDAWRSLPSIKAIVPHEIWLGWTGSDLVMVDTSAGTVVLRKGASEWTTGDSPSVMGPIVSAGDRLFGVRWVGAGGEAVQWIPDSGWEGITSPPGLLSEPISAGDRVLFLQGSSAYDTSSTDWRTFEPSFSIGRLDHVAVWAGDRLVIWGGWRGGPGVPFDTGLVIVPAW